MKTDLPMMAFFAKKENWSRKCAYLPRKQKTEQQ